MEAVAADGDAETVNATVADPDIAQALSVLPTFLNSGWIPILMEESVVGIDYSTNPASFNVIADDGSIDGESDEVYAGNLISDSFEGVPVEVSIVDVIDLTTDAQAFGGGSN